MSAQRASQLVEAGLWLRLSGDHEGARRLFEQALKLDPSNARARQLLDSPAPKPAAQPTGAAKAAGDVDWGGATGQTATPPPIAPVSEGAPKTRTRPFGEGTPPGTHTVRLGEAEAPEIPEAPRFEDPHGEVMITGADEPVPDNATLVYGMSGVPVPPVPPSNGPQGGTMVFGKGGTPPQVPPVAPVGGGTLVFGSKVAGAPPSPAVPQGGTLVFGASPVPPVAPVGNTSVARPGGGTLVFGAEQAEPSPPVPSPQPGAGTLVFGATKEPAQPGKGTLVFGSSQASSAPPAVPPVSPGNSTLAFGSVPPSIEPLKSAREVGVVTEPGLPEFDVDDFAPPAPSPQQPGTSSTGTLEFNFDDMVAAAGPPPPVPSPGVPQDKGDAPQTAWDKSNPRIDITQIDLEPGQGGGFDIIAAEPPPPPKQRSPQQLKAEISTLLSGAKDLLDLDDHSGAMELIGKALELDPSEPAALKLKDRSEKTLQAMYESKLGDLNQIPRVKLKEDEIIWLNLDHRAGFVLAQIDGNVSFEEIFAVSGMSRLDTARILAQLVEEGVISKG